MEHLRVWEVQPVFVFRVESNCRSLVPRGKESVCRSCVRSINIRAHPILLSSLDQSIQNNVVQPRPLVDVCGPSIGVLKVRLQSYNVAFLAGSLDIGYDFFTHNVGSDREWADGCELGLLSTVPSLTHISQL